MIVQKTHISPEDPHEPIFTKFGTAGRLTDLIIHDNFFGNRLRGFDSVRGRILAFFYLQAVALNTVLALPHNLWLTTENLLPIVSVADKYRVSQKVAFSPEACCDIFISGKPMYLKMFSVVA